MAKTVRVETDIAHARAFSHKFQLDRNTGKWYANVPEGSTQQLDFFRSNEHYTVEEPKADSSSKTKGATTQGSADKGGK